MASWSRSVILQKLLPERISIERSPRESLADASNELDRGAVPVRVHAEGPARMRADRIHERLPGCLCRVATSRPCGGCPFPFDAAGGFGGGKAFSPESSGA